ncbi:hypothetical protein GCM10009854_21670 [Saccharopolyspora halophila]|uniref:Uncharacterized protein n=1 Tax=Saccharopolyspora halophila TaxID=405551 RepID=A0ABN3G5A6_9PSEU
MSGALPEEIHFRDLAKQWVDAVARHFAWRGGDSFHECWVGDDLAIYVRYVHSGRMVATRFDDLLTDYLSGFPISLAGDDGAATSSMQASNLYDGGIAGAPPEECSYVDGLGYRWWGDRPPSGWQRAIESAERLTETVRRRM